MNWKSQIYRNGYIRTMNEIGSKRNQKEPQIESQEKINMCLTCTKKKCNGNCIDIRRKENETKSRNN